jgi:hypothetical protein
MDRFAGVGTCEPSFVLCNIGEKKGLLTASAPRSRAPATMVRCYVVLVVSSLSSEKVVGRKSGRKRRRRAQDDKALLKKPICVGTLFEALVDTLILFFRLILSRNCGANEGAKSGWNECC